jgi:hypothetical protein
MVALQITIDLLSIAKMGLNINEYLTLMKLQHDLANKTFPFVPDERFIPSLIERGLVKNKVILSTPDTINYPYELTEKGIAIFEGDDLFEEFYAMFPHKVPTDIGFRPVSTLDPEGTSARATHAIWNRITKGKAALQRRIIDNLRKELIHRKKSGTLGYLHNIDTWLRHATWEKWEDISDVKESSTNITKI